MENKFVFAAWLIVSGALIGYIGAVILMWHDYKRRGWVGKGKRKA